MLMLVSWGDCRGWVGKAGRNVGSRPSSLSQGRKPSRVRAGAILRVIVQDLSSEVCLKDSGKV